MEHCKECGSYAINPHCHGREQGVDLDLCDVCYWRKRAESAQAEERERCAKIAARYVGCDHIADAIREGASHE